MEKPPTKCYYMGRPIEELTRDELLEAVVLLATMLEDTRKQFNRYLDFQEMVREQRTLYY